MRYLFIFSLTVSLLLMIATVPAFSQSETAVELSVHKPREIAKKQINVLRNGSLLVRLMKKSNSIAALRERGENTLADKVQRKQMKINTKTVLAFRVAFDFCPVYFFYSDYTEMVREKQLDKVNFLNDQLEPDSSIRPNTENFLIAEFGNVLMESGKHHGGYYYYKDAKSDSMKKSDNYSARSGFPAVIIKNNQFIQMRFGAFPYYARTLAGMRNYENTVAALNKKLHRFYELISALPSAD